MLKRSHTMIATALIALSTLAMVPAGASAQVGVSFVIGTPPPLPRFESVPPPRHGYVWAPGYWGWNGRHYVWLAGRWEAERYGYQYRPAAWLRDGDGWRLDQGGWVVVESRHERERERWERRHGDRDHDGIPNRYDHDRDGDGVPNRYDRHPDNPYRD